MSADEAAGARVPAVRRGFTDLVGACSVTRSGCSAGVFLASLAGRSPGPHERYQDLELRLVRAGRRSLVLPGSSAAAWYCSTTLAGIRPRSLTAMRWSFAQAPDIAAALAAGRAARRRCSGPRSALRACSRNGASCLPKATVFWY